MRKLIHRRFANLLLFFLFICVVYFVYAFVFASVDHINHLNNTNKPLNRIDINFYMSDERWSDLTENLRNLCDNYKAHVGVYLKDLKTQKTWEYNADRLFRSASLIKLPIMIAVMNKVEEKQISLDTELTITDKDRMDGSGSLKWAREGTTLSLLEIIYRMITDSDNTATKLLIDYFGIEYFKSAFRQMGLAYTNITLEGMSLTSGRVAKENYTTPREMAYLLEKIYRKEMVSKSMSEMMLDILKRNRSRSRIRKGVPLSWQVGHKTGLLRKSCSDVGIVFSPHSDYILAILLDDVPSYRSGKEFIAKIARVTSEFYKI
ncbi:MAG: class A beta-lactamase-related serine hydrolase [Elusimicrobiota bacterium]